MTDEPLVWRFPMPDSKLIDDAYWDLERSSIGTQTEQAFLVVWRTNGYLLGS